MAGQAPSDGLIARTIQASVDRPALVVLLAAVLALLGIQAARQTPLDAIPDLSDTQVIVVTQAPGQSPQVVQDQVTTPLSAALLTTPQSQDVRGYSFFGLSMIYVVFEDGMPLYDARSRVLESLSVAQAQLPEGVTPQLGPDATGVGWVFQYLVTDSTPTAQALRSEWDADEDGLVSESELPTTWPEIPPETLAAFDRDGEDGLSESEWLALANFRGVDLQQLRSVQDWQLRYDLMAVEDVAEVASVGGFVKQYQVVVDPEKLRAFGLPMAAVRKAVKEGNQDVGGRVVELAETEFMVRSEGRIQGVQDLEVLPVGMAKDSHTPILLQQVAHVQVGPELRRGLTEWNGLGEVVSGIVVMRQGGDAIEVIAGVKERLEAIQPALPQGVEIHVAYDRSALIQDAVRTLRVKLLEEMAVVALVCLLFLLHFRSALVPILSLPVGVLAAFAGMRVLGVGANIMSLGGIAIAIGVMVDASVVMVENLHKQREHHPELSHREAVIRACTQVGPALFFSLLIVTLSFAPVFGLQQQEGRMFRPLAWTKTLAMGFSALLSVTLIPALMVWLTRGKAPSESDNPLSRWSIAAYRPLLKAALRRPWVVLAGAGILSAVSLWPTSQLGSEFMPPLNEGSLLYMPTTPPGLSVTKAKELLQQTDALILAHPQVEGVLGKVGRAETATDPAPLTMIETTIQLTPKESWPAGKTIEDIAAELNEQVRFPGLTNSWTMPIKTRMDMQATGIKTPVGLKLSGDDLQVLSDYGRQLEAALSQVDGVSSVYAERAVGGNYLDVQVRRMDAARFGLSVADVQDTVRSGIGGQNLSWAVEGLERVPINLRLPRELRSDPQAIARIPVATPMGHTVPLAQLADIELSQGPPMIKSENARPTSWVLIDLDNDDLGGSVARLQAAAEAIPRPPGVSLEWSGQYAYMQRAKARMAWLIPLTLVGILLLLTLYFRDWGRPLLILLSTVLFAPVGGVWLLWALDFKLSVAVGVGFIALLGLSAETGVVMLVYLDEAWESAGERGGLKSAAERHAAIMAGAVDRLRPKLMTVATTTIGLLPILVGTETGTRVMKRIAAPMVGGLLSSTLLTLVVLPVLYLLMRRLQQARATAES